MRRLFGEKGQGLVEYSLILVLVAILVIGILLVLGPGIGDVFSNVIEQLTQASGGGEGEEASVMQSVDASEGFGTLTITVHVSEATTVSLSGGVSGSRSCSAGACTFTFSSYPAHGSVTATAGDGSTGLATW